MKFAAGFLLLVTSTALHAQDIPNVRQRILRGETINNDEQSTPEHLIRSVLKSRVTYFEKLATNDEKSVLERSTIVRHHVAGAKLIDALSRDKDEHKTVLGLENIVEGWGQLFKEETPCTERYSVKKTVYTDAQRKVARVTVHVKLLKPSDKKNPELPYQLIYIFRKDEDKWFVAGCVIAREKTAEDELFQIIDARNALEYLKILDK